MILIEVIGAAALVLLVVAATWMAVVGLLGTVGAVRLKRCRSCGHLQGGSLISSGGCPYCRHPWLVHHVMPVHLHHLLPEELAPMAPIDPAQTPPPLVP